MSRYPFLIQRLIEAFSRFPSIGPKTAERFVFYLLKQSKQELDDLSLIIKNLKTEIKSCSNCFNFSLNNFCSICADPKRDRTTICVVAEAQDLEALERTNTYYGVYHLLGGTLNVLEGITPKKLRIKELMERIKKASPPIQEIILALDPDLEGETTVLYLTKLLKPFKIKITRLARGLPTGSDLEYADEITLSNALEGRKEV